MRTPAYASPDDIDLAALFAEVKRSLPRLLLLCVAAGAVTFVIMSMMAKSYTSEAQLAIVAKGAADPFSDPTRSGASPDAVSVRMDKEAINTHVRALLSPDLGAEIVKSMHLADRVEFNSALGSPDTLSAILRLVGIGAPRAGESEQDRVLGAYFRHLDVYSPKESRFIGIRFTSMDPDLAAAVANKIAETYRERLADQSVVETDEVQKALEAKINKLTDEVAQAEAAVDRFRGEANIFKGGQQATGLNEQQLAELTAELSKAQAARSEAEARSNSAHEMMKSGSGDALPDVQKSPLIQNLVQQRVRVERQISELSATLLPGHPRMRQLNADLAGLKRQISAEVAKIVDGLDKEAKVAAMREASVNKSLNDLKARVVNQGPEEVKLRSLESNAKSKRAELDRLRAQYEANRVRADSRAVPVEAQIVTMARPSSVPSFPKTLPYTLLMMAATLLFGMALIITRALLHGARRASASRRQPVAPARAADPSLGTVPAVNGAAAMAPSAPHDAAPAHMTKVTSMSDAAHRLDELKANGVRGVRTLLAGETESVLPAEEAAELVKELAGAGHATLVIDWSTDGRGIAEKLGCPAKPGITELLDGTAKFEDVISTLPGSGVHVIACGKARSDTAALSPDRINAILDALDEVYDEIIVVGRREPARRLFEAIQGRFDAGIIVSDGRRRVSLHDEPNTFLGYEVEGIEIISFDRPQPAAPKIAERALKIAKSGVREALAR